MKIYESISNVISEIGAIGKTKKNQQQGFMYRGIDDVMNALQPILSKHRVFIVPQVLEQTREERQTTKGGLLIYSICKVKYTFFADDGSSFEAIVIGEGMDPGDKATNKAMSIAFKYACFQVFCIPTEEMLDPDSDTPEPQPKKSQKSDTGKKNEGKGNSDKTPDKATKTQLDEIMELAKVKFKDDAGEYNQDAFYARLKEMADNGEISTPYYATKNKGILWTVSDYEAVKKDLELPF